jgi:hypothetical protein
LIDEPLQRASQRLPDKATTFFFLFLKKNGEQVWVCDWYSHAKDYQSESRKYQNSSNSKEGRQIWM